MTPLFLQPFLSLLSKEGFCITARDYRRISIALRAEGAWTIENLKAVLLALLVKNPNQEALFVERFGSFFRDVPEDRLFDSADDVDRAFDELKRVAEMAGKRSVPKAGRALPEVRHTDPFTPPKIHQKKSTLPQERSTLTHDQSTLPREKLPFIKSLSPAEVHEGAKDCTLAIKGDNFTPSAKVFINGQEVSTRFISPQEISAVVPPDFTVFKGPRNVSVGTEDGKSASAFLKIVPKPDTSVETSLKIGVVLFVIAVVVVFLTTTKEPQKQAAAPVNTNTGMIGQLIPLSTPTPSPIPTPAGTDRPTLFSRLSALSCLVAVFLYCLYLNSLKRAPEDNPRTWNPTKLGHFRLERIGGKPAARLDRRTLDQLAEALRYQESDDLSETLNIDASVEETSRRSGLTTLVYFRKRQIPTVVIAEDAYAEPTAWNPVARELAEGLGQRGIQTIHGKFLESPLLLYASNHTTYNLAQFEEQKDNFLVLFFSDSKSFHDHNSAALDVLSKWPGVAWMELRERRFWDEHTWRIAGHKVPVFQATPDDLLIAMSQLSSEEPPQKHLKAANWRGLPLYAGGDLYTYVEYVLGDSLPWAQACAMIQPVTLGMADRLRLEFQPDLSAERVGRLFALPNTTYNKAGLSFSTPILSVLRYGFTVRWSEDAQRRILQFILERIREVKPSQSDSLTHLSWEYVYERVRLEVEPDKALKELAALDQTPLRDAIRAEFRRLRLPLSEHERTEFGYCQVPLRRRPATPASWGRLAKLTGSTPVYQGTPDVFKRSTEYLKSMRHIVR